MVQKIQFKTVSSQSKKQIEEKVGYQPDGMAAVRYPEKGDVGRIGWLL